MYKIVKESKHDMTTIISYINANWAIAIEVVKSIKINFL